MIASARTFLKLPVLDFSTLHRPYFLDADSPAGAPRYVHISKGELYVGETRIVQPQFGARSVAWTQQTADHYTTGHLTFSQDGLECMGTIASGSAPAAAVLLTVHAHALAPTTFVTQISSQRKPAETDAATLAGTEWQPGLELQVGFGYSDRGTRIPLVKLNKQDISDSVAIQSVQSNGEQLLKLTFALDSSPYCDVDSSLYMEGTVTISYWGDSFSGQITQTCADQSDSGVYLWKGSTTAAKALRAQAARTVTATDVVAVGSLQLSELFSLIPDEEVLQTSHALLLENAKWAMAQDPAKKDWVKNFFGQTPPELDASRKNLITQSLDWYQNDLSPAYLTQGLNSITGSGAPSVKLTPEQQTRLDYHLRSGYAASSHYNLQAATLYGAAHLLAKPRLRSYVEDTSTNWATAFLEAISTQEEIRNAMNLLYQKADLGRVNGYTALLQALDPSGDCARQYQNLIMSHTLLHSSQDVLFKDEDAVMQWLPTAMQTFLDTYRTRSPTATATTAASDNDAQTAADATDELISNAFGGDLSAYLRWLSKILVQAVGRNFAEQYGSARAAFEMEFPNASKAVGALQFLCFAGALASVVLTVGNWSALSDIDKAKAVTQCVQLVSMLGEAGINIFQPGIKIVSFLDAVHADKFGDLIKNPLRENADSEFFAEYCRNGAKVVRGDVPLMENWNAFFANASRVFQIIGVAVQFAFGVLSALDLAEDIRQGKPMAQQALDGIVAVASFAAGLGTAIEIGLGIAGYAITASVFAIASAVFAIIGVIAAIVMAFLPRPQPDSPVDTFMKNDAQNFVNSLEEPSRTVTAARLQPATYALA